MAAMTGIPRGSRPFRWCGRQRSQLSPREPKMTQIVRYTHPTPSEIDAVMLEARQMRSEMVSAMARGLRMKLRGLFAGGKATAAA